MTVRPLIALLLSDGKAGHYSQAEGVIAALGRLRAVEAVRLEVRRRFIVPTRTLHRLVNAGASPAPILRLGYGLDPAALPRADLVVSAGGETLAANAAAAKLIGAPNIFCGRLRRVAPEHVSLVIVSLERFGGLPNHLVCLPPSPLGAARPVPTQEPIRYGRARPPTRVGVLVGGNSGAFRYANEDWDHLLRFLRDAHRTYAMRWLVTTSRRSGTYVADALAVMAAQPESGIERFVDYRTAGPGTLAQVYAAADAILVTDDSTTMISEAVSACLPAVAVGPGSATLEEREAEYRTFLASHGWYRRVPLAGLTSESFLVALEAIAPRTTSALEELAAALSQHLPELLAKA